MSDIPSPPPLDEVEAARLHGAAGGNVPLDGSDDARVRKIGDVSIRIIDESKGRMEVTDKNGRFLLVQRLSELERFDLYEAFGSTLPNAYTSVMASLAATLRSVKNPDGTTSGRVFPRNMTHIRGAITLLGEAWIGSELKAAQERGEIATQQSGRPVSVRGADTYEELPKATLPEINIPRQRAAEFKALDDAGEPEIAGRLGDRARQRVSAVEGGGGGVVEPPLAKRLSRTA